MKKLLLVLAVTGLMALISGCGVSSSEHNKVVAERDAQKKELSRVMEELARLQEDNNSLKNEIQVRQKNQKDLEAKIEDFRGEIKKLRARSSSDPAERPASGGGDKQYYEVKKGDSPRTIAKKAGVSVETLKKLNPDMKDSGLKVGQKIRTK